MNISEKTAKWMFGIWAVIVLAWFAFVVWAIYSIVTWVTAQ